MCVGFGRKNSLHQWLQLRNIVNLCKFSRRRRRCCCPLCAAPMRQAQRRERARHSSRRSRGRNANNINAVAVAVAPHRHDLHNFWRVWGGWGVAFCLICMWPSCCCLSDSDCVCPKCVCVCVAVSPTVHSTAQCWLQFLLRFGLNWVPNELARRAVFALSPSKRVVVERMMMCAQGVQGDGVIEVCSILCFPSKIDNQLWLRLGAM